MLAGAAAVAAAWFYTGGSRPYGYRALGEISVFVFFGVFAVTGTAYVQLGRLAWLALAASVPVGLLACALLVVNNLRDIGTDAVAGKRTLAVVLGEHRTRLLYVACALVPFGAAALIAALRPVALAALAAIPLAVAPVRLVRGGRGGSPAGDCARADRAAATGIRGAARRGPRDPAVATAETRTPPPGAPW